MNEYEADMQMQADEAKKRLGLKWYSGLNFFHRSTDQTYRLILASRHWPHIVTWSWFLDYAAPHADKTARPWGFQRWSHNTGWGFRFWMGLAGSVSFHRQTTDWMVAERHKIVNVPITEQQTRH